MFEILNRIGNVVFSGLSAIALGIILGCLVGGMYQMLLTIASIKAMQ